MISTFQSNLIIQTSQRHPQQESIPKMLSAFFTLAMATSALAAPSKDPQRRRDEPASYLTFTTPGLTAGAPERVWKVVLELANFEPDPDAFWLSGYYGIKSPAFFEPAKNTTSFNTKALHLNTENGTSLLAYVPMLSPGATLSPGEGTAQAAHIAAKRSNSLPPSAEIHQWDNRNGIVSWDKKAANEQFLACEGGFSMRWLAVGTASNETGEYVKGCVPTTVKQVFEGK